MLRLFPAIALIFAFFVLEAEDVTKNVQRLGNPFRKGAYARNVWDMTAFGGKIWFGHGNGAASGIDSKAGPVPLFSYDPADGKFVNDFIVDENQIDMFTVLDGKLVIPGSDSRLEGTASFYCLEKGRWKRYATLTGAKRIFDMRSYGGRLFSVTETDGKTPSFAASDDGGKTWTLYPEAGTGRRHVLFELNGTLYTPGDFIPSTAPVRSEESVFEYAGESLVIRDELTSANLFPSLEKGYYTMRRCTAFNGKVVFIGGKVWNDNDVAPDGVFYISSLARGKSDVTRISLPPKSIPRDLLVRNGRLFILTEDMMPDGSFTIRVFTTRDFGEWNELFSFKCETFARSFEILNGDFYFGLGTDTGAKGSHGGLSQSSGTILKVPKEAYLQSSALTFTNSVFHESSANDGSMDNSSPVGIYLTGDLFSGADGDDFIVKKRATVSGLPKGLTPLLIRKSPTVMEFTITGHAENHGYIQNGIPFMLSFKNTAFRGGSSARLKDSKSEKRIMFGRFVTMTLSTLPKNTGELYPGAEPFAVPYGQAVMIRCIPAKGYIFNSWKVRRKKDGSRPLIRFADRTKPFTSAAFAEDVEIVADLTKGGVTLTLESTHDSAKVLPVPGRFTTVRKGTSVKLEAEPEQGMTLFSEWRTVSGGDGSTIADPAAKKTTVTLDSDTTVRAVFVPCRYLLTVENGRGTGIYEAGQTAVIKADPPPQGKIFDRWNRISGEDSKKIETNITITSNITVQAQYRDAPAKEYSIAVTNGTGSGNYRTGANIVISADRMPPGKMFDRWEGDLKYLESANHPVQTFVMPAENISFTAIFKDAPGGEYKFKNGEKAAMYRPGTIVKLTAGQIPQGRIFDRWEGGDGCIQDIHAPETTLRMPEKAVEVKALYRENVAEKVQLKLSVSPSGAGVFQTEKQDSTYAYPNICTTIRVKGNKDYIFDHWETSGNVTLASPDSPVTTILPAGPCSLRAVFISR